MTARTCIRTAWTLTILALTAIAVHAAAKEVLKTMGTLTNDDVEQKLLKGRVDTRTVWIKLDDTETYIEKLADLIKRNDLRSLTVAIMTVPCCSGLWRLVEDAIERSGVAIEPKRVVVGIDGKIV